MPTLPVNTGASATLMAQGILGSGVTVANASYSGDRNSSGIYNNGDSVSPGVTPRNTGVILLTGRVRDFTNNSSQTNQSTNTSGMNNSADFNALAGTSTYDAAILDVDFIPTGDTMTIQFVFSSEEYPDRYTTTLWACGSMARMFRYRSGTAVPASGISTIPTT